MNILSIIFGIIGFVSLGLNIFQLYISRKFESKKYRYSWSDVMVGVRTISDEGIKKFKPNIVISFSTTASIIAGLVLKEAKEFKPFYTVMIEEKSDNNKKSNKENASRIKDYELTETDSYKIYIPASIKENSRKSKIILIDDSVVSSRSSEEVKKMLVSWKFSENNIKTWAFLGYYSKDKRKNRKNLNLVHDVDFKNCYLPWGKAK